MNSHGQKDKQTELLVSIIVPIYNVEKYLNRCVDSIVNQSHKNIEIILVDDGSTDGSPAICDNYADMDNRVIVLHKTNGGLSDARNAGLLRATGKYVAFVDSDDYVHENYIDILLYAMLTRGADVSVCKHEKVYGNDSTTSASQLDKNDLEITYFTNVEALKDVLSPHTKLWVTTWNKLYKREHLISNGILFPVGKIHEDNFTTYKIMFYAKNGIAYVNQPLYYYLQRNDSIMGRKFDERRVVVLEAVDETKEFIAENALPLIDEVNYYEAFIVIGLLNSLYKAENDEKYEKITDNLIKRLKEVSRKSLSSFLFHHKIMLWLILYQQKTYKFLIRNVIK